MYKKFRYTFVVDDVIEIQSLKKARLYAEWKARSIGAPVDTIEVREIEEE